MRLAFSLALLFLTVLGLQAQNLSKSDPSLSNKYKASDIIDPRYGIQLYEGLNHWLEGDSLRKCNGTPCTGWVEDFYEAGQKLHRGYYVDGALKIYTNFFPDGKVEREFRALDEHRYNIEKYYQNGNLKSKVKYYRGVALEWFDYHENGNLELHEETSKGKDYVTLRKTYFANGLMESELVLEDKKNKRYQFKSYFENGNVQEEGQIEYSEEMLDYLRIFQWKIYNESGKLVKQVDYIFGKINSEETF